jgi:hypothetical protein
MLALWGWSLIPPIENWDSPYEDGFSYVAVFYATITCLPVGLYLLVAAIGGRGRHIAHARTAEGCFFSWWRSRSFSTSLTRTAVSFLEFRLVFNLNEASQRRRARKRIAPLRSPSWRNALRYSALLDARCRGSFFAAAR